MVRSESGSDRILRIGLITALATPKIAATTSSEDAHAAYTAHCFEDGLLVIVDGKVEACGAAAGILAAARISGAAAATHRLFHVIAGPWGLNRRGVPVESFFIRRFLPSPQPIAAAPAARK